MKLDPKLKVVATTAYQLGVQDGEKLADKRIRLLKKPQRCHKEVWAVLTTLEKTEPLDRIVISVKFANRLKKLLSKHVPHRGADWHVGKIRKLLKEKSDKEAEILALCLKELAELKE